MKKWLLVAGTLALVSAVQVQQAEAQVLFGPQVAWGDDTDLGVGGRVEFGLGNMISQEGPLASLFGMVTGTYFFMNCGAGVFGSDVDCSYIEFNANAGVPFTLESGLVLYGGTGLHVGRTSVSWQGYSDSNTEIGLNLLGGVKYALSGFNTFAEAKLGLGGASQFMLQAGVLFGGK
jgi:opacity protein-like surface antigen